MRTTSPALATLAAIAVALTLTTGCTPQSETVEPTVNAECAENIAHDVRDALERGREGIAAGYDIDPAKLQAIADLGADIDALCAVER